MRGCEVIGYDDSMPTRQIQLRGVAVHNLKNVDLDLPLGQLIVFCGVSGSGKTSLAIDTLYAEGQRRYIESFSTYTRQFLDRPERPEADRIDGIPAAIAVTRRSTNKSSRSTIGTTTEIADFLRLLYAKIGQISCIRCGKAVTRDTPQSIDEDIRRRDSRRFMVGFDQPLEPGQKSMLLDDLRESGFVRIVFDGKTLSLSAPDVLEQLATATGKEGTSHSVFVIVDRLSGDASADRLRDSLETSLQRGQQRCRVLFEPNSDSDEPLTREIDGRPFVEVRYSSSLDCASCDIRYPDPEPRLFSFNSPLGACPKCEGSGTLTVIDMDLVVPDPGKTLREGAIALWAEAAYEHHQQELLKECQDKAVPVNVPFRELTPEQLEIVHQGNSTTTNDGEEEHHFVGIDGFFSALDQERNRVKVRTFLSRWRSLQPCEQCNGTRLRPEALAAEVAGLNIAELSKLKISEALGHVSKLQLDDWQQRVTKSILEQVRLRLGYLIDVGVGYLTLDRTLQSLSGGETQRVSLTSALGSSLVNMLYVLDEPTVGLHPADVERLGAAISGLRDRGNTVAVVEHEEAVIRSADQIIEVGPGAGERGGEIVFQGGYAELLDCDDSLTNDYLSGRRGVHVPQRRKDDRGSITLKGASGNNLQNVSVQFPLGLLCLVTGVSGSGKSTLVQDTLYGAICQRLRKNAVKPYPFEDVYGDGQLDDVVLVDQSPIGRSPRSNPVTYIKAFDQIRAVFAETIDARTHNYAAGHFSFNVAGGRCDQCEGEGFKRVDMQFLADVYRRCNACAGTRYRREILDVTYRGRNISQVLDMTVRESFSFFRGQPKVQSKLKRLLDVGLDYLRLGQPANTLSAGEAQRLKLASYLGTQGRKRTLFILDEPTTGLHFADIVKLQDCFDSLLSVGHSLIIVEHNLQLIKAADYLIDIGPGAAEAGGRVVATGTPEDVAENPDSVTGRFLAKSLAGLET